MKKNKLLTWVAAIAIVFATSIASSACIWYWYQPEEPECLNDK
jgi:cyclic lactone autoinducer peptide